MAGCFVKDCPNPHLAKGYCSKHYQRMWAGAEDPAVGKHGTLEQRFWKKVDKRAPNECWPVRGGWKRYGTMRIPGENRNAGLHRIAYELLVGPIPNGMLVMHACDNPRCCNPAHLGIGSGLDNQRDMIEKGRKLTGAARGEASYKAILTEAKVRYIKAHPEMTNSELAKKYGVVSNTINAIRKGKSWAHIK